MVQKWLYSKRQFKVSMSCQRQKPVRSITIGIHYKKYKKVPNVRTFRKTQRQTPAVSHTVTVKRISDFLGCNLSEELIQKIAELGSFKSMKVNTMSNLSLVPQELLDTSKSQFFRKGEVYERLLCCFIILRLLSWSWLGQFSSTLLYINVCVLMLGIAGDWKTRFNSEQITRFSSVIRKELPNETFSLPWSLEWPTRGAITETGLAAGNRRISSMWKCGAKFHSLCDIIQSNLFIF